MRYSKKQGWEKPVRPVEPEYWQEALDKARDVRRRLPDCVHVTSALAYFLYRVNYDVCANGDTSEAMELITEAARRAPGDTAILRNRGRILAARQDFEGALASFNEARVLEQRKARDGWHHSLHAVARPTEAMLSAARGVVEGRELDQSELAGLTLSELMVVQSGLAARHGKSSELQPTDWLYFCAAESPLRPGITLTLEPTATSATVKKQKTASDSANDHLIKMAIEARE
jgi:hypothetical protein